MRHSDNEILIRGSVKEVMALAFDLPRWPSFLPHYRWVKVLEDTGERQTVEMACRRSGLPLRWQSHLWVDRAEQHMRFRHLRGPARGMEVEWTLIQEGELVRARIHHDLTLDTPLIRTALGRWIVGELFVKAVAGRTLRCLKEAVERG